MSDKRQNRLLLAFAEDDRREAPKSLGGGMESLMAKCGTEGSSRAFLVPWHGLKTSTCIKLGCVYDAIA